MIDLENESASVSSSSSADDSDVFSVDSFDPCSLEEVPRNHFLWLDFEDKSEEGVSRLLFPSAKAYNKRIILPQ